VQRLGQKGLERRLAAVQRNLAIAFPDESDPNFTTVARAVDALSRAVTVAGSLPLMSRKRAHRRIDDERGRLEHALIDAVLPNVRTP
jgi:hypothetical protein